MRARNIAGALPDAREVSSFLAAAAVAFFEGDICGRVNGACVYICALARGKFRATLVGFKFCTVRVYASRMRARQSFDLCR